MSHPPDKQRLLEDASAHVADVRETTKQEIEKTSATLERVLADRKGDPFVRHKLHDHFSARLDELHHLFPSPYFFRCDVRADDGKAQALYFSKFGLTERSIFSWTSPAARLRFAEIGAASYAVPETRGTWTGALERKDQFLIVGGKVVFMASETTEYPRTLVHQEQVPQRKAGFVLPEIVERMEKAQDDVIRAPADGSFLIAGPAGSGKTTLALHRIAYLLQSPDTAARFPTNRMLVLVQDERTKAYFSRLLPDLGIHEVEITTFGAWALARLGLKDVTVVRRPNGVDAFTDRFEHRKRLALAAGGLAPSRNPFLALRRAYVPFFEKDELAEFARQEERRELDRFDLALLLSAAQKQKPFEREEEYLVQKANYQVARRVRNVPLVYSLILVDEAQNSLPEQLSVLRACVDPATQAMLYVGDLGQQVLLGTLSQWSQAGESFGVGRRIELEKVYRNTKAILRYLAARGYPTAIPEEMADGVPVVEQTCASVEDELRRESKLIAARAGKQIGILAPDAASLRPYAETFAGQPNVHVLTVHEAQGVEFDVAVVLGFSDGFFQTDGMADPAFAAERAKIKRDLFYVALTRAMDELHVLIRA